MGYENGTVIIEPVVKKVNIYDGGLPYDTNLPANGVESLKRIWYDSNGQKNEEIIDLHTADPQYPDGKITFTGAVEGSWYSYVYSYPKELTTIPTIKYKVPTNQTGQIKGNSNMIQQNSSIIQDILNQLKIITDQLNNL